MSGFLSELKRRNVVKVGIAYAAIGWLAIEIASVVFHIYRAPDWVLQVFATLVLLGFPAALGFAWVYEVTPTGLVRTANLTADQLPPANTSRRLDIVIIVVLIAVVAVLVVDRLSGNHAPAQATVPVAHGDAAAPSARPAQGSNAPADGRRSIAVLPFVNLSSDPEQEYFSDGLTEELLNRLAQIPGLKVPARTSSFHFKGKTDLQEVRRALAVDTALEGSVRRSGQSLRITAHLVDLTSGFRVWSQSYDRELTEIFAVQDDITAQIVSALEVQLDERTGHLLTSKPVDTGLYQLMLRGRYHWNQRSESGLTKAVGIFQQAIELDPGYGPAYAGLADAYVSQFDYGLLSWEESTAKARAAAMKALELDDRLAVAHTSLAHVLLHEWQWQEAEAAFARAIELDPNYIVAHHWYALCLTALGRTEDAVRTMQRARDLDPLSIRINADLGMAYLAAGHYEQAVAQESQTLELAPDSATPKWIRGMALEQMGRFDEAERDMLAVVDAWERDASILGTLGHLYAVAGRDGQARELLAELITLADSGDVAFFVALVQNGLGET
ncbi:MAG: tetratricopeptide repeat protein, partial [Woeseiaceae bacterium]